MTEPMPKAPLLNNRLIGALSLIGLFLALSSLCLTYRLSRHIERYTPIAVLDRSNILRSLPVDLSNHDREAIIQELVSTAASLSDAGYLVLDRGLVMAAPQDRYVEIPH